MSRENLCCGAVAMVLWCCSAVVLWLLLCYGCCGAVGVVGAGRLGFLGRLVLRRFLSYSAECYKSMIKQSIIHLNFFQFKFAGSGRPGALSRSNSWDSDIFAVMFGFLEVSRSTREQVTLTQVC
jgi:hypothetical protein